MECVVLSFPAHSHQNLTFPIKYSIGKMFRKSWGNKVRDFFSGASIISENLECVNGHWNVVCSAS